MAESGWTCWPSRLGVTRITALAAVRATINTVPVVKPGYQSVAVLLLLGMLAGPALALASCWTSAGAGSQHACCPMTSKMVASPAMGAETQPRSSTCCQVSSNPVPLSQSLVPTGSSRVAPPAAQVASIFTPAAPVGRRAAVSAPPPLMASSLAALCTFLI